MWEAFDARRARRPGQPRRDRRRQPARPERRDDARLGHRRLRRAASRAFGWRAIEIDGHDVEAIDRAYGEALEPDGAPAAILARTIKGKGVAAIEDRDGLHGKPLADPEAAIDELGGAGPRVRGPPPEPAPAGRPRHAGEPPSRLPRCDLGEKVATRRAYGEALRALGAAEPRVVAMDGEVGNSTYAELFPTPTRAVLRDVRRRAADGRRAIGLQARGWVPFASTFAAFLTRAHDFIRMAAVSRADIRLVGSHTGVTVGEDGPSQMALEDIAMLRAVHDSTVLVPPTPTRPPRSSRRWSTSRASATCARCAWPRPSSTRPASASRSAARTDLRSSTHDHVTLLAAGVTVHEALAAADMLAATGVHARVIDLYSVKPLDTDTVVQAALATGTLIVVEDHWPQGGLGDAVLETLADADSDARIRRLAVHTMPTSGRPEELLWRSGIDRTWIATAARDLLEQTPAAQRHHRAHAHA